MTPTATTGSSNPLHSPLRTGWSNPVTRPASRRKPWERFIGPAEKLRPGLYAVPLNGTDRLYRVDSLGRITAQYGRPYDFCSITTDAQERAARAVAADPLSGLRACRKVRQH